MKKNQSTSRYTDQQYIDHDPFAGDRDVDVRASTVKIVKTRKPQICTDAYCRGKKKPAGTRMRRETAIVDGEWCTSYACLECIARWFDEEPGAVPEVRTIEPQPARMPCPYCGIDHLDVGEWETRPHHKHLCLHCGGLFRFEGADGEYFYGVADPDHHP